MLKLMCKWRQNPFLGGWSLSWTKSICMFIDKNYFALLSVIYNFLSEIAPMESESDNPEGCALDKASFPTETFNFLFYI